MSDLIWDARYDFAADSDEILFPSSIGALPVVGADSHLNRLLLQYADEALGRPSITARQRAFSC